MDILKRLQEEAKRIEKLGVFNAFEKYKENAEPAIKRMGGADGLNKLKKEAESAVEIIGNDAFLSVLDHVLNFYRKTPFFAIEQIKKCADQIRHFESVDVFSYLKRKENLFGYLGESTNFKQIQEKLFLFSKTDIFNKLTTLPDFNSMKTEVLISTFSKEYTANLLDNLNEAFEVANFEKINHTVANEYFKIKSARAKKN